MHDARREVRTCGRGLAEDALPVGHLQQAQVRLDAVLPSDPIVHDLDVQLSHPAQDRLEGGGGTTDCVEARQQTKSHPLPVGSSYLARVGVDPDFEAGVLSLEAVERVLEIFNKSNYQVNASFSGTGGGKLPPPPTPTGVTDQPAWPWWAVLWCRRRRDRGFRRLKAPRWPDPRVSILLREPAAQRQLPKPWMTRSCPP